VQQIPFTVHVVSGDGLIARCGDVVAYAGANDEPAAQLLAAVESVARTQHPGMALPEQLAPLAFGVARTVPFGVVAPSADGLLILLHGPVTADIETQDGGHSLSGRSGPRWERRVVPEAVLKVGIFGRRQPSPPASARTDLRAGVVPGDGFVLVRAGAVIDSSRESKTVAIERIPSGSRSPETAQAVRTPTPVETVMVQTPVGVLSTRDGATYPLDRAYVIGRAPLSEEAVRNAKASPIVVPYDPHVSRVHAYVTVERGGVFVRDAGTAAGTFIAAPGADDWTQVGTTPTKLEPGWSLRVGEWIVSYRTGNQR
jgi:FHA domain